MDELRSLFRAFVAKAKTAVLNLDNEETKALAETLSPQATSTTSICTAPGRATTIRRRMSPSRPYLLLSAWQFYLQGNLQGRGGRMRMSFLR